MKMTKADRKEIAIYFIQYRCRHSGRAGEIPALARKLDPESRGWEEKTWIPACAGMTEKE
jgi:hypothetical protein